jgi:NAD(P)-dependent dehydrogenase (short-subunit alcohol dehydrogenase family)
VIILRKSKWDWNNIPDQKGRIIVVTGATSGIGKETARVVAKKKGAVILAIRNMEKGQVVIDEICQEYPKADVAIRELDLLSLESVRTFAQSILNDYDRLDVLINNAGVMMCPYSKTRDGFEIQLGTNHLGHFALTGLLMPLLKKTEESRIVVVSSMAHSMGDIDFTDLNWEKRKYKPGRAYGDSKLANLYFTYELARRLESDGNNPKITAAHPGWTSTDLQRHSGALRFLTHLLGQGVEMGALPTLRAAFDKDVKAGDYFGPSKFRHMHGYPEKQTSNELSYNKDIARHLWTVSEEMTKVKY